MRWSPIPAPMQWAYVVALLNASGFLGAWRGTPHQIRQAAITLRSYEGERSSDRCKVKFYGEMDDNTDYCRTRRSRRRFPK